MEDTMELEILLSLTEKIFTELNNHNIEAIIDDTDENFSSKIKKMNLIGAPPAANKNKLNYR